MKIELRKFGTTLTSRQMGSEAYKALQPLLRDVTDSEPIEIDFEGVLTLAPSWGDEFLTPLLNTFGDRLVLMQTDNLSAQATIRLLEEVNKKKFASQIQ